MDLKILPISSINGLSERKRADIESISLTTCDREKSWAPPELAPLMHLEEAALFSFSEARRYNQLFALGIIEQFIWLETQILCPILERLLKGKDLDQDLKTGLENFRIEEEQHSELFWRLLQKAEPELYETRKFVFLDRSNLGVRLVESVAKKPRLFLVWVWMTIFFEERTLDFSRRYIAEDLRRPGSLDKNFVEVHRLHMQDELRHFMMDVHLLERFFDSASGISKNVAARMFETILTRISAPRLMSRSYMKQLEKEFPGFMDRAGSRILAASESLRFNSQFRKVSFSAMSTPRTYELLHRYSQTRHLRALFLEG